MKERREATERRNALFRSSPDVTLIVMKECEFFKELRKNKTLEDFYESWDPVFFRDSKKKAKLDQSEIISAIKDDRLFGVGVISVSVPPMS